MNDYYWISSKTEIFLITLVDVCPHFVCVNFREL